MSHPFSRTKATFAQWQNLEAQELVLQDFAEGLHKQMSKLDLYSSRREYCEHFSLHHVFRDKINQELGTATKYLHTLEVKGRGD